jgi:hypothetical protein
LFIEAGQRANLVQVPLRQTQIRWEEIANLSEAIEIHPSELPLEWQEWARGVSFRIPKGHGEFWEGNAWELIQQNARSVIFMPEFSRHLSVAGNYGFMDVVTGHRCHSDPSSGG